MSSHFEFTKFHFRLKKVYKYIDGITELLFELFLYSGFTRSALESVHQLNLAFLSYIFYPCRSGSSGHVAMSWKGTDIYLFYYIIIY